MRIVTWNVNSIRARQDRVLAWLEAHRPEVLCLQETKVEDEGFPRDEIQALGYHVEHFGQRTYNGVAILSTAPIVDVTRGLPGGERAGVDELDDSQSRFIAGLTHGLRVACCYVPQGQSVDSNKYAYKLRWYQRLHIWLLDQADASAAQAPLALCGDFNVAPDDRDVHDPAQWVGEVMCTDAERAALRRLLAAGLFDSMRQLTEEGGRFTWWDYRNLAFPKNKGLRIDLVLLAESLRGRVTGFEVHREERKGKGASDHCPYGVELS